MKELHIYTECFGFLRPGITQAEIHFSRENKAETGDMAEFCISIVETIMAHLSVSSVWERIQFITLKNRRLG